MPTIRLAKLGKARLAFGFTNELVLPYVTRVTIAPITSTIRGLTTEVEVGQANSL